MTHVWAVFVNYDDSDEGVLYGVYATRTRANRAISEFLSAAKTVKSWQLMNPSNIVIDPITWFYVQQDSTITIKGTITLAQIKIES